MAGVGSGMQPLDPSPEGGMMYDKLNLEGC